MLATTTTGSLQKNSSRQTKRLNHPVWTCHAEHSMAVCIALVLWIGLIPLSSRAQVPPEDHRALRAPEAIRSVAADTLGAKAVRQHPFTGTSGDQLGSAAAGGDVNGDGFSDVIVGAPLSGAGRVRIYFGGLRPGTTPDVTLTGTSASDRFGWSVAATDLNADGVDDVIVGAPLRDVLAKTNAGVAYVFYGARSWGGVVSATEADVQYTGAAMDDRLGSSVAAAGDANGDGWPDLLVGAPLADAGLEFNDAGRAYLFFGGFGRSGSVSAASADFSVIGEAPFDEFGHAVGSAGDVNGDGYADLLVGAPNNDGGGSNAGRGYVVLGGDALSGITLPAASADLVLTGASGERLGTAVSPAGDVNGDGFSDFVLGAPFASPDGRTEAGRADLYLGRAVLDADPDVVLAGAAAGDHFGTAVAAADDLNGDGYADVAVGANTNDAAGEDAGRAYVFFGDGPERGGPIQGGTRMDAAPDITLTGDASEDLFGTTLAPAGDVDGDGYGDLLVGAPGNDTGGALSGRAYLVSNRMTGTAHPNAVVTGPGPTGRLGESVAAAGDVNGDGYEDVLVGAPFHDEPAPLGENVGRAYLLYGGPQMDADPDVTITGEAGGDQFGEAVAPAGDVNGDGYGDIVVGVKLNDAGSSSGVWAGRTYVFFGGPNLPATLSAFEDAQVILNGEAPTNFFGWSVASAGDVNADGFSDIIVGARDAGDDFTGRAYVFLGGPDLVGTLEAAAADMILIGEATDDAFGFEVAPVGDVDGDGYDDVGVLAPRPNDSEGLAYLFRGRAPLPAVVDAADATFRLRAEPPFTWLASIAGADLNRDGFSDLIVGSRGLSSSTDVGRVGVVFGGTDLVGTISTANVDVVLRGSWGDDANDRFGTALAAGDINADGFSDIVVGAHFFPLTSDPGRAYAFYGGPTLDTAPDVTYYGEQPEDQFGLAVATGDVNGDGRSDVMVGAPWNDSGGADAGRLYLYTAPPPVVVPRITSVRDVPADQGGQVAVAWTRSGYDVRGLARITRYLVQRSQPPGPTGFQWETVATVPASQEPRYSDAVPTYNDQTDSHRGTTYFRIVAETDHPDAYWRSMVARGASVDNLAPETPEDPLLRVDRS
ncbi:MAG: hypothetical protein GVY35_07895, partial [Bacteroidetes bacterium]|nr:hypothetical protein [Bacteroidota bacterium]